MNKNQWTETVAALIRKTQLFEAEIADLRSVISALKDANKGKDELCDALVADLTTEREFNARWEKFAHAAMKQQAELLGFLEAAGIGHGKGVEA